MSNYFIIHGSFGSPFGNWFPYLRKEIDRYIDGMNDDDYLFPSRKGDKPITRVQGFILTKWYVNVIPPTT